MFAQIIPFKLNCIVTSGFQSSMSTHQFRAGHTEKKTKSTHVMHMVIVYLSKYEPRTSNYMLAGSCHVGHPVRVKLISQEKGYYVWQIIYSKIT